MAEPVDDPGVPKREDVIELVEGARAFAERAAAMVSGARLHVAIFSYDLDRRIYGTEGFLGAVRKFTLQHAHARMRVLVNAAGRAAGHGGRFVEFGRAMASFIEFRDLPEDKATIQEEYLITDGRLMLYRETPRDLEARYYPSSPHLARLKLRDYDALWNESPPAQELRSLRI